LLAALLPGSFRLLYLGEPPKQEHPDRIDASEFQARSVPLEPLRVGINALQQFILEAKGDQRRFEILNSLLSSFGEKVTSE
jgi:hypothetical protein